MLTSEFFALKHRHTHYTYSTYTICWIGVVEYVLVIEEYISWVQIHSTPNDSQLNTSDLHQILNNFQQRDCYHLSTTMKTFTALRGLQFTLDQLSPMAE